MIIDNIAKQFGVTYQNVNNESLCPFPSGFGSGYVKSSYYPSGIEIVEINGVLTSSLKIKIPGSDNFLLNMIFNLRWAASYNDSKGNNHIINRFSSIFNTQDKNQESSYEFGTKEPISLYIIVLHVETFKEKFDKVHFEDESEITKLFTDLSKRNYIYSESNYTLSLQSLILKYQQNNYLGIMRYIYLEAKATEIILERLNQYLIDLSGDKLVIKRASTLQKVEAAALSISKQLNNLGTTKEIALSVNLSEGLLQSGFKQLFKCTVNQFIVDLRLNKAIDLLDNSEFNITEITYELGIKSRSYFSKVFKERFGISPLEYRKLKNKS